MKLVLNKGTKGEERLRWPGMGLSLVVGEREMMTD